jgi:hypothetical protein
MMFAPTCRLACFRIPHGAEHSDNEIPFFLDAKERVIKGSLPEALSQVWVGMESSLDFREAVAGG